jgi:hypothetical protein
MPHHHDAELSHVQVLTYKISFTWASRWASLVRVVLLRLLVVVTGTGMWFLGSSSRSWDSVPGLNGPCFGEGCSSWRSLWTTHFLDNLLHLFLTTAQLYIDHSSQLGSRTLYNGFLTYFLLIHLLTSLPCYLVILLLHLLLTYFDFTCLFVNLFNVLHVLLTW